MILLDLFCGAGGASVGYARAGYTVVGVDSHPQPNYPFEFHLADALKFDLTGYDAIHASPPCKVHTSMKAFANKSHQDLIPQTRARLESSGIPHVIENVVGAPLRIDLTLCGSMFDLGVRRHRLFESNVPLTPLPCRHEEQNAASPGYPVKRYHSGKPVIHMSPVVGIYGRGQGLGPGENKLWAQAMGIDWMTRDEMAQAIPPAYTEYIGNHLRRENVVG